MTKAEKGRKSETLSGLSSSEAAERLVKHGPNRIEQKKQRSLFVLFIHQFKSPIVYLLAAAAVLSLYYGERADTIAILIVILINALIGFFMENKAERSMMALKKMTAVQSKVIREGQLILINSEKIVPDDIVFIEAGDLVPADGHVINSSQLQANEAALTGESLPVEKSHGDNSAIFKGTFITRGNGYIKVSGTGMQTELGKIAEMVQASAPASTPLEKKLEIFSRKLIKITLALVVLIFIVGLFNGIPFVEMLNTAIALSVAAIPEGLPIVATLALARGMIRMARHNVIVKKLSAVETLGGTTVICTDKTGTLTQNKIEVEKIAASEFSIAAKEKMPDGEIRSMAMLVAVLCGTAEVEEKNGKLVEVGDPLETALIRFAKSQSADVRLIRKSFPRIGEIPFSAEIKMMATLHEHEEEFYVFAKGAGEELLKHCRFILTEDGPQSFNEEQLKKWLQSAEAMASNGFRVIGLAYKRTREKPAEMISGLVFIGLTGMIDPPREEVKDAIHECHSAGINVVMVTGDHPSTALHIAKELGIAEAKDSIVITGQEMKPFADLTEKDKSAWLSSKVFARSAPAQKLDLVKIYQEKGDIVAMTGDGVNDGPALKKADIAIAMGIQGTQVAQEIADMILRDDSFSSIRVAIREGRIIFDNIRKFVVYLLSCNMSELLLISCVAVFNFHFQLFPLQILFVNLITDVLPALALGMTRGARGIMLRPPRSTRDPLISNHDWKRIFIYSFVISACCMGAVLISHYYTHPREEWNEQLCNNILFYSLIFSQLFHVLNMGGKFSGSEVLPNGFVWGALLISSSVALAVYYLPFLSSALSVNTLSGADWSIILCSAGLSFILNHILNRVIR